MSLNEKIKEQVQKLQVGELITLFEVDTSIYDGDTYYFAPYTTESGSVVEFNGVVYNPIPAKITGYTLKADGSLARPTLAVGNADRAFNSILLANNDLNGCLVRIRTTFRNHLDDGDDPDPTAQVEPQTFRINQKTAHSKDTIQWELAAMIDNQKAMIPRHIVAAERCIARYRIYNSDSATFTYNDTNLACPYTGTSYFDEDGQATGIANDKCGKDLYNCKLRFPNDGDILPYMQFVSIDRG